MIACQLVGLSAVHPLTLISSSSEASSLFRLRCDIVIVLEGWGITWKRPGVSVCAEEIIESANIQAMTRNELEVHARRLLDRNYRAHQEHSEAVAQNLKMRIHIQKLKKRIG